MQKPQEEQGTSLNSNTETAGLKLPFGKELKTHILQEFVGGWTGPGFSPHFLPILGAP